MLKQEEIDILKSIWKKDAENFMTCPKCGSSLTIVQLGPRVKPGVDRILYETVVECSRCSFNIKTSSFTVYGAVKDFDDETIEIASWSSTGSREVYTFNHHLDKNLLKELKSSGELVEFLIVNGYAIVVIG
ncbi:MAG TPA: hypothetical protein ENG74_00975 [Thermoplasmatales archaeon]|nr:hypothetical protein [Thermoplasmatales archaeon]